MVLFRSAEIATVTTGEDLKVVLHWTNLEDKVPAGVRRLGRKPFVRALPPVTEVVKSTLWSGHVYQ